ncbi:MAG: tetraacyldisaccharide 4'-kinase [Rhizobiaceae bacterium MnEN-MB40S]|nr:MAG: tetraacyldisaccharide 4'-kinase [Rhizobiaceae bacterium MnEN-MB40S]
MVSEAPPFWWARSDWRAWCLSPLAFAYGRGAAIRMRHAPRAPVDCPVICIGNLTVGGAGKTPTALALADIARRMRLKPGFLTRGYGGSLRKTALVDPSHHYATEVGDEPLLLADKAPTAIAPKRVDGAELLIENGVDLIIMDDGFQSAKIAFDYALLVIDARRGVGNGHVLPAGPVRAPLIDQIRGADGLLVIGDGDAADRVVRMAGRAAKPVYEARLNPLKPKSFRGKRVLAWAGIGDPGKFFRSLETIGARVELTRSFGDHHSLNEDEMADLLDLARRNDLQLVTTSKDMARLRHAGGETPELATRSEVLDVRLKFDLPDLGQRIIEEARENFRKRRISDNQPPV